jgi:hypothetical protein
MAKNNQPRKYPRLYEHLIPIAIGILVLIIAGMLVITIAVALNLIAL